MNADLSAPMIELKGVKKAYTIGGSEIFALNGITLKIWEGDFLAVMGSSGSGKSTLMNILGCLDVPSDGDLLFMGESVSRKSLRDLAKLRRDRIGFVFQSFNLLPRTSAYRNVEMPLMYNESIGAEEAGRRVRSALEAVHLENRMEHTTSQLSGGQQQRVAIARALVNDPSLILADEPTGNLDSRTSVEIMNLLTDLNRGGKTIILVTHEPDIAGFARRRIVLRDGVIIREDSNSHRQEEVVACI